MKIVIEKKDLEAIMQYLSQRPYSEVAAMMKSPLQTLESAIAMKDAKEKIDAAKAAEEAPKEVPAEQEKSNEA